MRADLLIVMALAVAGVPPLNESQRVRLAEATDGSRTIDEAALYALLENARRWPAGVQLPAAGLPGAVVPDYEAIREDPEAWRGRLCLIEGTLERVLRPRLARSAGAGVAGLVLRVDEPGGGPPGDDVTHSEAAPTAEDFVIAYLTDPPPLRWRDREQGVPFERGGRVRLAARFYKTSQYRTQGGPGEPSRWQTYLTFVGRGVSRMEAAGNRATGPAASWLVILTAAILAGAGYVVYRASTLFRRRSGRSAMEAYLERRRWQRGRAAREAGADRETGNGQREAELPADPAEALHALANPRKSRPRPRKSREPRESRKSHRADGEGS